MATVGDRVHVASRKLGQPPREGVVTGVSGRLLRVRWSTGEESTIVPGTGSVSIGGKARVRITPVKAGQSCSHRVRPVARLPQRARPPRGARPRSPRRRPRHREETGNEGSGEQGAGGHQGC